jgi:hypothetical protein
VQYKKICHFSSHLASLAISFLFISGLFTQTTQFAQADTVKGLYEARIPVESQARDERTEALRQAFMQVLIRVTGRIDIAQTTDYPSIQEAIELATRYAQRYRYLKEKPSAGSRKSTNLILWVRFDEAAVSRLLQNNNIPVWGSTRPNTLVWLAIDNRGKRELVGNNSRQPARNVLVRQSYHRGVPLRLPLLDLTDRSALRTSDVWGNFESTILQASQRYKTEAVLVGRVFQSTGGYWNARWSLYSDSRRQDWSASGSKLEEVIHPGIDNTAEALSSRYASATEAEVGTVLVQVKDLKTLADYNRTLEYLKKLSNVSSVQPFYFEANHAIFKLTTPQGRLGVARSVALGRTLVNDQTVTTTVPPQAGITPQQKAANQVKPDLVYRLVP